MVRVCLDIRELTIRQWSSSRLQVVGIRGPHGDESAWDLVGYMDMVYGPEEEQRPSCTDQMIHRDQKH